MNVRFPDKLFTEMLIISKREKKSVNRFIVEAVREKIRSYYREKKP